MKVEPTQLKELLVDALLAGVVPMVSSSPGMGKSSIAQQIADDYDLQLIDIRLAQCDPTELNGFPKLNEGKATYVPMDIFPLSTDALPKGKTGWLILFDEFSSAPLSVQAAAYKIILDRKIGQFDLHSKALMMAAGNLMTDNAVVSPMSTAMQSRLIHLELEVSLDEWKDWAYANSIDSRIIAYVNHLPNKLHDFSPEHNDKTFPCPRTWSFLSNIISKYPNVIPESKLPLLAGTIGEGTGLEFFTFTKIYQDLLTFEQIIANPTGVKVPNEPSNLFALGSGISSKINSQNAALVMPFISRLPAEFQVVIMKDSFRATPKIQEVTEVKQWLSATAHKLM